jgi:tRNA U34 2-thiouridine synthase MnmA/TrmU
VSFLEDVTAVVPGQYAVFYAGDRVLGGGVINSALGERQQGVA